ncbi:BapA prefix-like domain-containing protein [Halomonas sp. MCCC 1A11036]|uniref:BapA prefix-like domain-containing protein n=1 Tax=Billgrantia zhangzhouensis TaxID=2733481 RepID=A0ABS9A9X6_9GAMM|nr:BapA/Bap/LapF family large adhesin [Halomonas zhangzhouensis]MCE8018720.1 BapA prefix-like domain-containing protein [Halomonas zhangzhouensis]
MSITVKISLLNEDVTADAAWEVMGDLIVERPSNILLNLHPDEVTSLIREGDDLVVTLADGRTLRIVDFYIDEGEGHSELYLVDENDGVLWLDLSPAGPDGLVMAQYVPQGELAGFEMLTAAQEEAGFLPGALLLGGAIAGVAIAAGSSSSGDSSPGPREPGESDNAVVDKPEIGSATNLFDDNGDPIGTEISGTAEPGVSVEVRDAEGALVDSVDTDAEGNWSLVVEPALSDGEEYTIVAVDEDGNVSDPVTVVGDTTPPETPTVNSLENVLDDSATLLVGTELSGTAEPGTVVEVRARDGSVLGEVSVEEDGSWRLLIEPALEPDVEYDVVAVDSHGNVSPPTVVEYSGDALSPAPMTPPTIDDYAEDGSEISGSAEPGSEVTVSRDGEVLGTGIADADGQFTIELDPPVSEGEEIVVEAVRPDTGVSESASDTVPAGIGPMTPPTIDDYAEDGSEISGSAEPGSEVTVSRDGEVLGTGIADADGQFTIELDSPVSEGEEIVVEAARPGTDVSESVTGTVPDGIGVEDGPLPPTLTLANDTGIEGDGITSDGSVEVGGLVAGATWEYSLDGGENWIVGEGNGFVLEAGEYADGQVRVRQTDEAGTTSAEGTLGEVAIVDLSAADDNAVLDMGEPTVVVHPPQTEENVQVLGLLEGGEGDITGMALNVSEDHAGDVVIEIQQTALVAVADAFILEIYDAEGRLVYAAATENSLVGDVAGLEVLGLLGDDTLTATVTGLPAGEYSVVVRNGESALEQLVDGLTLEELGEAGVVLGPDNQDLVLGAIEGALGPVLGPIVTGILEPVLDTTTTLGAGELVGILTSGLDALGMSAAVDEVLDAVAEALLSNTLTLLQFTDITTRLTEYSFDTNQPVEGNVITGDADGAGEDQLVPGSVVAQVTNSAGESVDVPAEGSVELAGLHGVLTLFADGSYHYAAYGDRASVGEVEVFTYTVSDGSNTAEATLSIEIQGTPLPELNPADDTVTLDMGTQAAVVHSPEVEGNVQVLGLLEGGSGGIVGMPLSVAEGYTGEVMLQVNQTALAAVADGYLIEILDASGNRVFAATTPDSPLIGDVAGIGLLGLIGDDTLAVTVPGLAPGDYTVVVRNDQSAIADLLTGMSLDELGESGVILGPDNQELILDAVSDALGGLGGPVRGVLELALNTLNGTGVGGLVDVLTDTLGALGLTGLLDDVIDAVAVALVSNTLTLLQSTTVEATLTEYRFEGDTAVSGNVITGEGEGNVEDELPRGSVVTEVANSEGESVTVLGSGAAGVTLVGLYGVLTIHEDGGYTYSATGARAGLGQEERFTYTVSDGIGTATAELIIHIDGQGAAGDIAFADVQFEHATLTGSEVEEAVNYGWLLGIGGVVVPAPGNNLVSEILQVEAGTTQDVVLTVNGGDLLSLGGGMTLFVEVRDENGSWQNYQTLSSERLIGLLGIGGDGEFVLTDLAEGDYRIRMEVDTGLASALGSVSAGFRSTVTLLDQFELAGTSEAVGNLLENDVLRGDDFTLSVSLDGDEFLDTAGGATLSGQYGELTVSADGSYVYVPNSDLGHFTEPLSESFTYRLAYPDGTVEEAQLTLFVRPSGAGVEDVESAALLLEPDGGEVGLLALSGDVEMALASEDEQGDVFALGDIETIELSDSDDSLTIQGEAMEDALNAEVVSEAGGGPSSFDGLAYYHTFEDLTLQVRESANLEVS